MTNLVPDTRNSLILRLPDKRDVEAWDQFASIYEPLVYRLARARGLQDADAQEVVQEVFLSVARAVERWQPNPEQGRFRDWLFRIARNLMIKFLTRPKYRPMGTGDCGTVGLLNQHVDPASAQAVDFDLEYRREVFRWAADRVQTQVKQRTWRAFWMTAVEGRPTEDVARELNMTVGAIHIARSRVRCHMRDAVKLQEDTESQTLSSDISQDARGDQNES